MRTNTPSIIDSVHDSAVSKGAETPHYQKLDAEELNRLSGVPVYKQIYSILKKRINSGVYADRNFPSARDICDCFGVSRISARQALDRLAREGLISMARGRKTIAVKQMSPPLIKADFSGLIRHLSALGAGTEVELIDVSTVAATAPVANALSCSQGASVKKTSRRRWVRDAPFSYIQTFMPLQFAERFPDEGEASAFSLELFRQGGILPCSAVQSITACCADDKISEWLGVVHGAPILKISRTYLSEDKSPIIHTIGYYKPELFAYEMTLEGVGEHGSQGVEGINVEHL